MSTLTWHSGPTMVDLANGNGKWLRMERKLPQRLRFLRTYIHIHTLMCSTIAVEWWQRWRWRWRRSDLRLPTMAYRKYSSIHRLIRSAFIAAVFTALYLLPSWPTMLPGCSPFGWLIAFCGPKDFISQRSLWSPLPVQKLHSAIMVPTCRHAHIPTHIYTHMHLQFNGVGKLFSRLWDICCRNWIERLPKNTNLKRFRLIKKYAVRSEKVAPELAVG